MNDPQHRHVGQRKTTDDGRNQNIIRRFMKDLPKWVFGWKTLIKTIARQSCVRNFLVAATPVPIAEGSVGQWHLDAAPTLVPTER